MEPWTKEQNKRFEQLLAVYDEGTPDRWQHVARGLGKSVEDVKRQYRLLEQDVKRIESGNYYRTLSPHTACGPRSGG